MFNKNIVSNFIKSLNQNAPLSNGYKYPYKPILLISMIINIEDNNKLFNSDIYLDKNSNIIKTYYDLITNCEEFVNLVNQHKSKKDWWNIGFNLNVRKQVLSNIFTNPAIKLVTDNNNFWETIPKKKMIRINVEIEDNKKQILRDTLLNEAFICLKKCMPEYKDKTPEEILNYSECLMSQIYSNSEYIKSPNQGRKYQYIYSKLVKDRDQKCKICCLDLPELLHACHIKPYTNCDNDIERYDENNGITLCCNHHKLFDSGYFTFTKEWRVQISSLLLKEDQDLLIKTFEPCYIHIPQTFAFDNQYIDYHNNFVFIKN